MKPLNWVTIQARRATPSFIAGIWEYYQNLSQKGSCMNQKAEDIWNLVPQPPARILILGIAQGRQIRGILWAGKKRSIYGWWTRARVVLPYEFILLPDEILIFTLLELGFNDVYSHRRTSKYLMLFVSIRKNRFFYLTLKPLERYYGK